MPQKHNGNSTIMRERHNGKSLLYELYDFEFESRSSHLYHFEVLFSL